MNTYTEVLRKAGLHVTSQRIAVMRAIEDRPHSGADLIIESVQEALGTVSRQTVYDALNVLSEKGVIRRIQPTGSPALYETRTGDNHHHLVCRNCSAVMDVDCAVAYAPCLTASDDHDFSIDEAEVVYWGYCPSCKH